jgi:hypothetical protein
MVRVRVYDLVSRGVLQASGALVTREPQNISPTRINFIDLLLALCPIKTSGCLGQAVGRRQHATAGRGFRFVTIA